LHAESTTTPSHGKLKVPTLLGAQPGSNLPEGFSITVAQTDKLTHKDVKEMVKHDAFRERTMGAVEYVSEHKSEVYKYVAAGVALIVVIGGFLWYRSYQHNSRQEKLTQLLHIQGATVTPGEAPPFQAKVYKTEGEKTAAIRSEFAKFAEENKGTDEGAIASYYLGTHWAESGNIAEAEKYLKAAAEQGSNAYSSLAKLALAQMYGNQGKVDEGAKLLQSIIDKPSQFVSKEHATIEKARLIAKTNPVEARKILEPLRTSRAAISQAALALLSEIK
jgi:predicted negative regulator of RcsB-dependent stress response